MTAAGAVLDVDLPPELATVPRQADRQEPVASISFDCGNGLHAPLCAGCGCSCHTDNKEAPRRDHHDADAR